MKDKPCPNCGHCPTCGHSPEPVKFIPMPYPVPAPSPWQRWPYSPNVQPWGPQWVNHCTTNATGTLMNTVTS